MVVMKFGGSSVATAAALARVTSIVGAERRPRVVVVSALGGVTDELLALAGGAGRGDLGAALGRLEALRERHASMAAAVRNAAVRRALLADLDAGWFEVDTLVRAAALLKACAPPLADAIVAHGELASSRLVAAALADAGLPGVWVDARRVVVTDGRHQEASPIAGETAVRLVHTVRRLVDQGQVPVIGGFVGATAGGATTTLGRGGSDLSAALIAAGLGAAEVQIWTDVDGMLTADPRVFSRPRAVARLSFREASTLASFGAKVLHPSTARPAVEAGIPVRILNSRRPAGRGTLIADGTARRPDPVASIACLRDLCAFDVPLPGGADRPAALAAVYAACAGADAAVHLTAVSDASVSVVVSDGPAGDRVAVQLCGGSSATRCRGLSLVAVVGDGLASGRIAWPHVLAALEAIPLHLLSRTPGSNHVACVIDQANLALAVETLHDALFGHPLFGDDDESHIGPAAPPPALLQADQQEVRA
jgi:aspartate kinase